MCHSSAEPLLTACAPGPCLLRHRLLLRHPTSPRLASATDHNAPGNLEAGDAGDALSRDHGNLPADEVLPSHENGQAGDAALGADEDATKQVISHPKTRIRTPCE